MARDGVAGGCVGYLAPVCGGLANGHEGVGDVGLGGVPLQPAFFDDLARLEHQHGLGLHAIVDGRRHRAELLHLLEDAYARPRGVDAKVGEAVLLCQFADALGLPQVRAPLPFVPFDAAYAAAVAQVGQQHGEGGVVAASGRVVAAPYGQVAHGVRFALAHVLPVCGVDHAGLELRQPEHALRIVDELAAEELPELLRRVLELELGDVEQVTAARLGIGKGDDVAKVGVGAEHPGAHGLGVGPRSGLGEAPLERLARPQRIRLVRDGRRGGEERAPPSLVGRHARGDLEEFLELGDPEELVDVHMPVVALRTAGTVRQEVQLCLAVGGVQHHGVAGEGDVEGLARYLHDVVAEHLRLRLGGG